MSFYSLPPVGERIQFSKNNVEGCVNPEPLNEHLTTYFDSGTSALAAAICSAVSNCDSKTPEVILPAYGCPDLVSASIFAGALPILVDLDAKTPRMNLELLEQSINKNTTAIIAVNFLGLPENTDKIKHIINDKPIALIEDSAQWFPDSEEHQFNSDYIIFSFGRGKPINLLHGGAVLSKTPGLAEMLLDVRPQHYNKFSDQARYLVKAIIYNRVISPYVYHMIKKLPFLHLGVTRFKKLDNIEQMQSWSLNLLTPNIKQYRQRSRGVQKYIQDMLKKIQSDMLTDLPTLLFEKNLPILLRYPILINDLGVRNNIINELENMGLGASIMYPTTLDQFEDTRELCTASSPIKEAMRFANHIITLPTHSRVKKHHIDKIFIILQKLLTS